MLIGRLVHGPVLGLLIRQRQVLRGRSRTRVCPAIPVASPSRACAGRILLAEVRALEYRFDIVEERMKRSMVV
uniref:Uncharacterized protein n=1 Tax=Streptomyces sp. F12 TaxID=1436084 RepID=V9Z7V3_9ACTN|nr:hypothetical protein pFRL6_111c [Streptomyces sp. F12]